MKSKVNKKKLLKLVSKIKTKLYKRRTSKSVKRGKGYSIEEPESRFSFGNVDRPWFRI